MTPFGKILRRERQERNQLLGDFAKMLNVSPSYLSQIETGARHIPDGFDDKVIKVLGFSGEGANELRRAVALSRTEFSIQIGKGPSDDDRTLAYDLAESFARLSPEGKDNLRRLLSKEKRHG